MYLLSIVVAISLTGAPPVPFTTIVQGQQSGIEEQRDVVVRSEADWKALWREHAPDDPAPAVDFATSMVVGVFLGSRSTGGFEATITAIDRTGADLVVTWREERPGGDAMVSQVLTSPFHLVRVERIAGHVKFQRTDKR